MKKILGFFWDLFLLAWSFCLIVGFGLSVILMLHMGEIISAEPVIVVMNHVIDGGIRWVASLMFP